MVLWIPLIGIAQLFLGDIIVKNRFTFRYEHRELLNDVKNVVISYTPLSGIFDTLKFLNKWLFRRKKIYGLSKNVNKRYRMFRLKMAAKKYNSP